MSSSGTYLALRLAVASHPTKSNSSNLPWLPGCTLPLMLSRLLLSLSCRLVSHLAAPQLGGPHGSPQVCALCRFVLCTHHAGCLSCAPAVPSLKARGELHPGASPGSSPAAPLLGPCFGIFLCFRRPLMASGVPHVPSVVM